MTRIFCGCLGSTNHQLNGFQSLINIRDFLSMLRYANDNRCIWVHSLILRGNSLHSAIVSSNFQTPVRVLAIQIRTFYVEYLT
jgi:hypothetical protein